MHTWSAPIVVALAVFRGAIAMAAEPVTVKLLSCYDGDTCILEGETRPGRDRG
jgi:hypothetical protein